jgi:hypothetical protein
MCKQLSVLTGARGSNGNLTWLPRCMQKLQTDAGAVMEQHRAMLNLEMLLEASMNDEDIERTRKNAEAVLAERESRFMKLFADYQLQKTHIARAIVDAKTADRRRDEAEREAKRLAVKVERLEVRCLRPQKDLCMHYSPPRLETQRILNRRATLRKEKLQEKVQECYQRFHATRQRKPTFSTPILAVHM